MPDKKSSIEEVSIESKILKGEAFQASINEKTHFQLMPIQGGPDRLIVKKKDISELKKLILMAEKLLK